MTQERLIALLDRLRQGSLSDVEYEELMVAVEEGSHDAAIREDILAALHLRKRDARWTQQRQQAVWERIRSYRGEAPEEQAAVVPIRRIHRLRRVAVAASVALLVSAGILYFVFFHHSAPPLIAKSAPASDIAAPVASKAVLTLSNGRQIILDSARQGSLAIQGSVQVVKQGSAQIVYQASAAPASFPAVIEYNTLSVPRGSKVASLVLSDGTKVWLSVASSLRYPTRFTGSERVVTVTGEAYFEVAHRERMPFKVKAGKVLIEDIGTHFNINAYEDEPVISTTLLQGSVKVSALDSSRSGAAGRPLFLTPGEQALISRDGQIRLQKAVDTEEVMSWKEGYFHFESAGLATILREFSRWYDMEVVYEGKPPADNFFVIVNRNSSLASVLKALQAGGIHFRIVDRRLIVQSG